MARETTRRINRQVVEALEGAAAASERAGLEWNAVLTLMRGLEGVTVLHKDLVEDAWAVSARIGDFRGDLLARLAAERDGLER